MVWSASTPNPWPEKIEEDGVTAFDGLEERAEFLLERIPVLEVGDDLDVLLVEADLLEVLRHVLGVVHGAVEALDEAVAVALDADQEGAARLRPRRRRCERQRRDQGSRPSEGARRKSALWRAPAQAGHAREHQSFQRNIMPSPHLGHKLHAAHVPASCAASAPPGSRFPPAARPPPPSCAWPTAGPWARPTRHRRGSRGCCNRRLSAARRHWAGRRGWRSSNPRTHSHTLPCTCRRPNGLGSEASVATVRRGGCALALPS